MDMGNPSPTQRQRDRKNYYQERTSTDAFLLGWALEESTSTSVLAYCNGLKANWVVNLVAAPSPKPHLSSSFSRQTLERFSDLEFKLWPPRTPLGWGVSFIKTYLAGQGQNDLFTKTATAENGRLNWKSNLENK